MPRTLKIIGKSALCFVGLTVLSWAVGELNFLLLNTSGSFFYGILKLTLFEYISWPLLCIGYAYVMLIVFKAENKRALIITLNGAAVFVQFFILLMFNVHGEIIRLSFRLSSTLGLSIIILEIMLNHLVSLKKSQAGTIRRKRVIALLSISAKSAVCLLGLIFVLYGYSLLYKTADFGVLLLYSWRLIFSVIPVLYACVLYKLNQKTKFIRVVMMINAAFLLAVWSAIFIPDIAFPLGIDKFLICAVCGNTATMTVALAFIFRSVEKHGNNFNQSCLTVDSRPLRSQSLYSSE